MKRELLTILGILLPGLIFGQDISQRRELYPTKNFLLKTTLNRRYADSLHDHLRHLPDDKGKVNVLNALASHYQSARHDSSLLFILHAKKLADQIQYPEGLYQAIMFLGNHYGTQGNGQLNVALSHYKAMLKIAEAQQWTKERHEVYSIMLNVYFYLGNFPAAMSLSTQGLALAEAEHDITMIAHYKNLLAFIYLRQGRTVEARNYYEEYRKAALAAHDSARAMDAELGLTDVLLVEGKPHAALAMLERPSEFYMRRFIADGGAYLKTEKVPYSLFAKARAYRDMGDLKNALKWCQVGFACSDSIAFNHYDLASYYFTIGSVYQQMKEFSKAISVYNKGLNLSRMIFHAENIRDGCGHLANTYESIKQYDSALQYQKLYTASKDSILNIQSQSEIQRINALYDINKKDVELLREKQLHAQQIRQQDLIRNSLLAGMVALAVIGWLVYNRFRIKAEGRARMQLASQRSEMLSNFIHAQNAERNRMARDMHDQIGTLLSAAKLKFSELEDVLQPEDKLRLQSSLQTLDMATDSLRAISHNLAPASLARLGLVVALEHFFSGLQRGTPISIQFSHHHFSKRLPEQIETNLYPIVLELTNNVLKHANARNLIVQLIHHPDKVNISIEDDGIGFDRTQLPAIQPGLGLISIESRIEILKGFFLLDSSIGRGTTIIIDIPLP